MYKKLKNKIKKTNLRMSPDAASYIPPIKKRKQKIFNEPFAILIVAHYISKCSSHVPLPYFVTSWVTY